MGLFGNKDLRKLETELLGVSVILTMPGLTSPEKFNTGIESAFVDAATYAANANAAGKGDEVRRLVAKQRAHGLEGGAKEIFDQLLDQVESALG